MTPARALADLVVAVHAAYVAVIVFGLAAILVGGARGWAWVRNRAFRLVHLAMIAVVVAEAWAGVTCPLTALEKGLRRRGGQEPYALDFIEYWTHRVLFYRFPSWVFLLIYTLFGLAVLASLFLVPPRWSGQPSRDRPCEDGPVRAR
jgi:hypothetical protein